MKEYFSGEKLIGDDFNVGQIREWYDEESEGYAHLGNNDKSTYEYHYHNLNYLHGFSKIPMGKFDQVLGMGSAWGYEFEPIISNINNLTIIEPSDELINNVIGELKPAYVKPAINGELLFDDDVFDLITCFGTMHHIPNVTFVLEEMIRVLKPGGYLLIREPIVSMGDWRFHRIGLTKNERGIPVKYFEAIFRGNKLEVISKIYCLTGINFVQKLLKDIFVKPLYSYKGYIYFDKYLSSFLRWNCKYHPTNVIQKIAPQSIFFVLKKMA